MGGMSSKTVVFIRHGQKQGSQDTYPEDLGPMLTVPRGEGQATGVQDNPIYTDALKNAKQPLFVASNLIRAVQTMALVAPRQPIVVQPLARELIKGPRDGPAAVDALERWAHQKGVELRLRIYREDMNRLMADDHAAYYAALCEEDGGLFWKAFDESGNIIVKRAQCALVERAQRLMQWLGALDADVIFIVSHGDFLQFGVEEHKEHNEHTFDYCDVKTFELVPGAAVDWRLRASDNAEQANEEQLGSTSKEQSKCNIA